MRRFLFETIAHIIVWGIIAFVAGTTALIFAGAVGGVAVAVSPESNFGLADRFVCGEGGKLVREDGGATTWTDENGPHSGRITLISCVAADGTRTEGKELQATLAVIGLYFLACFAPLMIIGALISLVLVHMVFSGIFKKQQS